MNVVLISTYDLGQQPFGVASPAAWLKREGCRVACFDLAVERLDPGTVAAGDLVAFYLPMHTATRLACDVAAKIREINPAAHLCFYGLYAPLNESLLRRLGADTILGGEFEAGLASLVRRLAAGDSHPGDQSEPLVSLDRQRFLVPDRGGLPGLERYVRLHLTHGELKTVGYTEATRGCLHLCRHCPVVPVYRGSFRVVQRDVVIEDVRRQVAAGAEHITFGDPDFFNGPGHALAIVRELHDELPELTYDVTIKVEHLLKYAESLPTLRDTGCLFVTSAVEAVDDRILEVLDKGHTRAQFIELARLFRENRLQLNPTFVPFTPWTTPEGYLDLLEQILDLALVDNVAPIQYGIRLLVTPRSRLLELDEVRRLVGELDEEKLVHPWAHPDPRVDRLCDDVLRAVHDGQRRGESRRRIFRRIWSLAREAQSARIRESERVAELDRAAPPAAVPFLTEPWYC